jgi:Protein of unknown function (DUF3105)
MPNPDGRLVLALAAMLLLAACSPTPAIPSSSPTASPGASASAAAGPTTLPGCASLEAPADEGRAHVADGETVSYGSYPPTSGPHAVTPAAPGWYAEMPPVEQLVHSLEHGFVVVYRSGLKASEEAALKARFERLVAQGYGGLISVPEPSIKDPMTLTAWNRLQRCVRAEPAAFEGFVREHYAQAPEASAACGFPGSATLPSCEAALASHSPSPARAATAADDALLGRVPEPLRAACGTTTTLPEGAEAGWSCFTVDGSLAYVYVSFTTPNTRDAYFDRIVAGMGEVPEDDCATDSTTGVGPFTRGDGTTGRLACSDVQGSRALYWTVDGSADLGAVLAVQSADLRAFFETAGPVPEQP